MKRLLVLITAIATTLSACHNGIDYVVHGQGEGETETVYITETVVEEVEVPVYIEVEVPGETEYGEIWVDSDTQVASVDGVDILWVIDTSGSMHRYDAQLLLGIEAMIEALPESGWRLAMMSNDPAKSVLEAQFPLVPGDDIVDAMDMYNNMHRGPFEEGFDAAYEYLVNNPYATTWLRPDAATGCAATRKTTLPVLEPRCSVRNARACCAFMSKLASGKLVTTAACDRSARSASTPCIQRKLCAMSESSAIARYVACGAGAAQRGRAQMPRLPISPKQQPPPSSAKEAAMKSSDRLLSVACERWAHRRSAAPAANAAPSRELPSASTPTVRSGTCL